MGEERAARLDSPEVHDPVFFNPTAVPFGFDLDAPDAESWERFLADLWARTGIR